MLLTSWFVSLLRNKRRRSSEKISRKRKSVSTGWNQVEYLEDRTLLSAVIPTGDEPVVIEPMADVSLTKTSGQVYVSPGDQLTYTLVVTNDGPGDSSSVNVVDAVTSVLDNSSWTATLGPNSGGPTSGSGDLNESFQIPANESVTITIMGTVREDANGILTNVATAEATDVADPDPENNQAGDSDLIIFVGQSGSGYFHSVGPGYGSISNSSDIDLGDLDNDGDLDAVIAKQSSPSEIWLNDGTGHFANVSQNLPRSSGVSLGDFDKDGFLDIYFARSQAIHNNPQDQLWINNQDGTFTDSGLMPNSDESYDPAFGDYNNDGYLDVIVTGRYGDTKVLLNDGTGMFLPNPQLLSVPGQSGGSYLQWRLDVGDVDNDGDLDLWINYLNGANGLFLNDGKGLFSFSQSFSFGNDESNGIDFGDVDNDGDLDAVVAARDDHTLVYINNNGTFSTTPTSYGDRQAYNVKLADFNGDGYLDIYQVVSRAGVPISPSPFYTGDRILLNDGTGLFVQTPQSIGPEYAAAVGLGDLDGDGDIDAFTANVYQRPDQVWFNGEVGLPYKEDFNFFFPEGLLFNNPQNVYLSGPKQEQSLIFDNSGLTGLTIGLIALDAPPPTQFEASVQMTSLPGLNLWGDGFLIFDYKNENDFKYAGMISGQNEWVIGHYQGDWNNRIAEFDMDDINRQIESERTYTVHLAVNGNDVTLSVDGFGILYATVSEGIGNGSVGLASYNAVTKFDNLEVGAEVFAGKAVPFPYMENFNDGIANHFYFSHPDKWETITRSNEHVLRGNTSPIQANFATLGYVPISGLPQTYDISVKMKSLESNTGWHDGFLIFDYISPTSFKFAGMFAGQNQWVIGQYEGNWGNRLAQVDWDDTGRDILTNQYYDVRVRIDGNKATLFVDGELITSATFQIGIRKGPVGVAIDRAFTWFDDFKVSPPLTLDTLFEDFDDELVQELTTPDPTLWDFVELDESGTDIGFAADSTTPDELALQLTDPLYVLPPSFTLDVAVQFSPSAGNWQDGFLIFDYKNENDFKYAGAFAGQNEWAIGHYQGNWGDKLVVVDWDNEGKSIDVDTFYDLHLSVTGDEVRLSVDGVEIVTHTFAGPVNKGRAGFGAYNALTVFNDFLFDEILVP